MAGETRENGEWRGRPVREWRERPAGMAGETCAGMAGTHDHDCVVIDLSSSFPRRRESIGHHTDPHWGSFLESTESFMLGSIFSGASP